ncbi:MAG TPA: LacI family DNA-binding transcriptional regulator [Candidatus Brocadiia bacterium]|nr:LacI family DNA-binding transcriptional regulator [Candidatus Brocadiia bacterium]
MAATLHDIAKETGFAVSTVSSVLNDDPSCYASEDTRKAIRAAAKRLRYRPNFLGRALRAKRTGLVGVAASLFGSEIMSVQLSFFPQALHRIDCLPLFGETRHERDRERVVVQELVHKQVDGLILFPHTAATGVRELVPEDLPCVVAHERVIEGFPCLVIDRAEGVRRAAARLIELGHRRLVFIANKLNANLGKAQGIVHALQAAGLPHDGALIECGDSPGAIRRYVESHADQFRQITAVLASNDRLALEVIEGLARIGLSVPRDVSVVGYDDTSLAQSIYPPLTTIRQHREEVAEHATRMLKELMEGRVPGNVILTPELVERESTGPVRSAAQSS